MQIFFCCINRINNVIHHSYRIHHICLCINFKTPPPITPLKDRLLHVVSYNTLLILHLFTGYHTKTRTFSGAVDLLTF